MNIVLAVSLVLLCIMIYIILIDVYSVLFRISGLTKMKSRFQAISLLTNSGYTTSEAEIVTTNSFRRRIALASMITGYIFSVIIVSLVFNLINALSISNLQDSYITVLIVLGAFAFLFILFKLPFIKKPFEKLIEKLAKRIMNKNVKDNIITLLDTYDKDVMAEVSLNFVPEKLNDKQLCEINARDLYHINFLMLKRGGVAEAVNRETKFEVGDTVVVFGPIASIKKLFIANDKANKEQ